MYGRVSLLYVELHLQVTTIKPKKREQTTR